MALDREGVMVNIGITQDNNPLLTLKEAQAFLRVSRSKIYRLMQTGQLVGHKVGVGWRFYRDDLHKCVNKG